MLRKIVLRLFPVSTRRGKVVKKVAVKLGYAHSFVYDEHYQLWMEHAEEAKFFHKVSHEADPERPLFSIVIPMYNTADKYLYPLIDSIIDQSFEDWELILADGSTNTERRDAIGQAAQRDKRIKHIVLEKNEGISGNTNLGIKKAKGYYIVFSDHDDTLSPYALNELAAAVLDHPDSDILYSDEDKLTDDGLHRHWPHLKPDWSPHQFLTCNYTNHISAVRAELVKKVGGLRSEFNGAQDYDFLLRVHALPGKRVVHHVPKVLYHWREADGSTASDFTVKDYAIQAGKNAIAAFLRAQGLDADVSPIENRPGFYNPNILPKKDRRGLIIIGKTEDDRMSQTLKGTLQSITDTGDLNIQFVTRKEYDQNAKSLTKGLKPQDIVIQIKENMIPKSESWLLRLMGALELDDIYAISPRIIGYDGRIWDMGLVEDVHGQERSLFRGLLANDDSIYGHTEWIRDVDSLTGNFVAIRFKDFNGDTHKVKSNITNQYVTIWSPVEAVFYSTIGPTSGQYNENIEIGSDGSKTVLWQ